jgi:Secretion system C-terminal sorting domain
LYLSDFGGFRIKKVNTSGIITTIAGTGAFGSGGDGGLATAAQVFYPYGLVVDATGNLYFCESGNNKIRRIDAVSGIITTFAGIGGFTGGYAGDGGNAFSATFNNPSAITMDAAGNFFIGDYANNVIRKITMGATNVSDIANANTNSFVYPNPNNGRFNLKLKAVGEYTITNALGESIKTISIKDVNDTISIDGLSQGIYFVIGKQTNQKIIVY